MNGRTIIVMALLEFTILLSAYADPPRPDVSWEVLYSDEGITAEMGLVVGSPYKAFRGTGIVEARIGKVISILFDHTRANEWVHKLVDSIELRGLKNHSVVVWQRFDNPWPIKDRDFVYLAEPTYAEAKNYFRALFSDIAEMDISLTNAERSRIPNQSCCIVAKLIYTEWQFWATGPESTCVRVEVMLDPKGWVPAIFVNWFQTNWPYLTMKGLRRQAQKEDINLHEVFGDWAADHPGTAISRAQCEQGRLMD